MSSLVWPRHGLPSRKGQFNPAFRTISGGAGNLGKGQFVSSDAGWWVATFTEFIVHQQNGEERVLLWEAISGLLGGRESPIVMPVDVKGRRPLPAGVTDLLIDAEEDLPHDDGSFFDDDSGYLTSWIEVELAADAALRATTLSLTKGACGTLQSGHRFSIGERLYQIKSVTSQDTTSATVTINFPLREAVLGGTHCEFDFPVCKMRLSSDQEMDLDLNVVRHGFPSINMVEAL